MTKFAIYTISLICLNALIPLKAAIATGTSPLSAKCMWTGKEGKKVEQPCTVTGNSSAGSGTSISIAWQDGYVTRIKSPPGSSGFATPSGTPVKITGKHEHERILFPTYIQIQDQGIVTIRYPQSNSSAVTLPVPQGIGCSQAIRQVESELAQRGYYIPWETKATPRKEKIFPEVTKQSNLIPKRYFNYPNQRLDAVSFSLSGDMTKLYTELMSSPQFMAILGSRVMSECPKVGLVEFSHWWEVSVPIGYFSDGFVRPFTNIGTIRDNPHLKTVSARSGSSRRTIYEWGYYFSP